MPAECIQSVKSRYPTPQILLASRVCCQAGRVWIDFWDFPHNVLWLSSAGLNFDRLSIGGIGGIIMIGQTARRLRFSEAARLS